MTVNLALALLGLVVGSAALVLVLVQRTYVRRQTKEREERLTASFADLGASTEQLDMRLREETRTRAEDQQSARVRADLLTGDVEEMRLALGGLGDALEESRRGEAHEREELRRTLLELACEYQRLGEELRTAMAVEVAAAAGFRDRTLKEVAELLHRHSEMLRAEVVAAVADAEIRQMRSPAQTSPPA